MHTRGLEILIFLCLSSTERSRPSATSTNSCIQTSTNPTSHAGIMPNNTSQVIWLLHPKVAVAWTYLYSASIYNLPFDNHDLQKCYRMFWPPGFIHTFQTSSFEQKDGDIQNCTEVFKNGFDCYHSRRVFQQLTLWICLMKTLSGGFETCNHNWLLEDPIVFKHKAYSMLSRIRWSKLRSHCTVCLEQALSKTCRLALTRKKPWIY